MKYFSSIATLSLVLILCGCATQATRPSRARTTMETTGVDITLDTFHQAASAGMFELYFDQMTDDVTFMGTDSTEWWTKEQFMGYAREPFADGHGWTYTPRDRHVMFNDDFSTAWINELLDHDKYGLLRGTAVLTKSNDHWLIAQYSLTFLVPNDIAAEVVETIKHFEENNDQ
jgi:hypothetical protein